MSLLSDKYDWNQFNKDPKHWEKNFERSELLNKLVRLGVRRPSQDRKTEGGVPSKPKSLKPFKLGNQLRILSSFNSQVEREMQLSKS
ncbi:hypothetical protein J6590_019590 [Homalodisca vitripennis]|nr:hypothetical protein J6590_019590 [Homalodisca vitripennis]